MKKKPEITQFSFELFDDTGISSIDLARSVRKASLTITDLPEDITTYGEAWINGQKFLKVPNPSPDNAA